MADIGFNDNLSVSGRKFHFQTASNTKSGEVQCEIFEEGRLLSKEIIEFERRKFDKVHSIENRLKEMVESLHQEIAPMIFLITSGRRRSVMVKFMDSEKDNKCNYYSKKYCPYLSI